MCTSPCVSIARIDNYMLSLRSECEKLVSAVAVLEEEKVRSRATVGAVSASMQVVSERTQQLMANCNVILVNDGLREWHGAQAERPAHRLFVDVEANAVSWWVGIGREGGRRGGGRKGEGGGRKGKGGKEGEGEREGGEGRGRGMEGEGRGEREGEREGEGGGGGRVRDGEGGGGRGMEGEGGGAGERERVG